MKGSGKIGAVALVALLVVGGLAAGLLAMGANDEVPDAYASEVQRSSAVLGNQVEEGRGLFDRYVEGNATEADLAAWRARSGAIAIDVLHRLDAAQGDDPGPRTRAAQREMVYALASFTVLLPRVTECARLAARAPLGSWDRELGPTRLECDAADTLSETFEEHLDLAAQASGVPS